MISESMEVIGLLELALDCQEHQKLKLLVDAIDNFKSLGTPEERFLKENAFKFELEHIARTYLILSKSSDESIKEEKLFIEAFFTLSPQIIKVKKEFLFDDDLTNKEGSRSQAVLIGQIAKYKNEECNSQLNIKDILRVAECFIEKADKFIPYKIILIETKIEKLKNLYEQSGFIYFNDSNGKFQLYKRIFN